MSCGLTCDLGALSDEDRSAHRELVGWLVRTASRVDEQPDGYVVTVPAGDGARAKLARLVVLESRCCPFLDLELALPGGAGAATVSIRGPEGVKPFIEAELGLKPSAG